MTNLTRKAKIALGSAGAGVLALAVALGVWQPWNQPAEEPDDPNELQGEVLPPAGEEETLTLNVGGEKIPCTIFEGDGWQIYVPEGWEAEETEDGAVIHGGKDISVSVCKDDYFTGEYVSIKPIQMPKGAGVARQFKAAGSEGGWSVTCKAPEDDWDEVQKLMTAMVRTMSVGGEKIFSGLSPVASEPDWQIVDGDTLLWMDKDAYVVDDALKAEVEAGMMAWDNEKKVNFTGQYRMDGLTWTASYTCLPGREYADVFHTNVWYQVAEGRESEVDWPGTWYMVDDWLLGDSVYTVLFHDGSAVEEVKVIRENTGGTALRAELLKGEMVELTAEQLQACADWFNDIENNGLLRFPYEVETQVDEYIDILFYDLGEPEDTFTDAEKAALEQAGVMMELDVSKLTREYVTEYLDSKLGIDDGEVFLAGLEPDAIGAYLEEYDAWYQSRGDTNYQTYTFERGEYFPSARLVKLYYTAPFLFGAEGNDRSEVPMVVALRADAKTGKWRVVNNLEVE